MMPPMPLQGLNFRRKHLTLILGGLEAMMAFKAAVGSTPGRVHSNVVRATPFLNGRGPSRRIGTVVNTYALSLRPVSDAENREIERLFFDVDAILLPARLACTACTEAHVKCFARRQGVGYECAAGNSDRFPDERAVHEWVNHWRETKDYDYIGSEGDWLEDLNAVIAAARLPVKAPGGRSVSMGRSESHRLGSRWMTNTDELRRAGIGENELNDGTRRIAPGPNEIDDSDAPPRKRRHVSQSQSLDEKSDVRGGLRRLSELPRQRSLSAASHYRSLSSTSRTDHDNLPSPATPSRSANSPLDPEHPRGLYEREIGHGQYPHHLSLVHPQGVGMRSRSASCLGPHPQPQAILGHHPQLAPYPHPPPHPHGNELGHPTQLQQHPSSHPQSQRHVSARSRANSHQPSFASPHASMASPRHPEQGQGLSAQEKQATQWSQPGTPVASRMPISMAREHGRHRGIDGDRDREPDIAPVRANRELSYYYSLQGHIDALTTRIRANQAAGAALTVGLDELDQRKAELQKEQTSLKVDTRDRENEIRRLREEMMALQEKIATEVPRNWQAASALARSLSAGVGAGGGGGGVSGRSVSGNGEGGGSNSDRNGTESVN